MAASCRRGGFDVDGGVDFDVLVGGWDVACVLDGEVCIRSRGRLQSNKINV